jgi:hypothetical protein
MEAVAADQPHRPEAGVDIPVVGEAAVVIAAAVAGATVVAAAIAAEAEGSLTEARSQKTEERGKTPGILAPNSLLLSVSRLENALSS